MYLGIILAFLSLTGCSGVGVLNAAVSREGYTVERDVAYGEGPRQKLDIYSPQTADKDTPVIVFIYGGRWQDGKKENYLFVAQGLIDLGYIVVIPDYRLFPEVKYPAFLEDNAAAVEWVHRHMKNRALFIMGHSAGAYNAAMIALNPRYLHHAPWISGVIGIAGPYDFLPFEEQDKPIFNSEPNAMRTQPITYVYAGTPRFLLLAGDDDTTVKPKNSRNLYQALKKSGNNVIYKKYPDIGHIRIILDVGTVLNPKTPIREDIRKFIEAR
jgi:acetyl esterase/lipase